MKDKKIDRALVWNDLEDPQMEKILSAFLRKRQKSYLVCSASRDKSPIYFLPYKNLKRKGEYDIQ